MLDQSRPGPAGADAARRCGRKLSARARHPTGLPGRPMRRRDADAAARRLAQRPHPVRVALAAQGHAAARIRRADLAGRAAPRQDHPASRRAGLRRHAPMPALRAGRGGARRPPHPGVAPPAAASRRQPRGRRRDRDTRRAVAALRRTLRLHEPAPRARHHAAEPSGPGALPAPRSRCGRALEPAPCRHTRIEGRAGVGRQSRARQ